VLGKRLPVRIQTDNGSEFIRKSLDNGRMSTGSQWTSPALENQRITRLLNHLTAVCGMNA
jgi:putative transposase